MTLDLTAFEEAIKQFLDQYATEDVEFGKKYANPKKSISECCTYICQEVGKNRKGAKCVACTDEQVYGMAIHYYDEEEIKVETHQTPVTVATSQTASDSSEKQTEKQRKTRKPRKAKAPVDENIPEPLEIPIF